MNPRPVRRLARLLLERHLREHREIAPPERRRHVEHREPCGPSLRPQRIDLIQRSIAFRSMMRCFDGVDLVFDETTDLPLQLGDLGGELQARSRTTSMGV